MKAFARLLTYYKPYRSRLILSQVLLLISAACSMGAASLTGRLINAGILARDAETLVETGLWMLVLAAGAGICMAGTAYLAVYFSQGTAWALRTNIYKKIQTYSFANFDRLRTGNLLVRLSADIQNVNTAVMFSVMLLLFSPFMLVVSFVLSILFTPQLVWLLVVTAIVILVLMWFIVPPLFKNFILRQQRLDEVNNTLQENLSGMRVVKAFVREDLEISKFRQRSEAMRIPSFQSAFAIMLLNPLLQTVGQVARAVSIWVGGEQVLAGAGLQVGTLITFTQYLAQVITPLALMAILVPIILRGENSAERLFEIYDAEPLVKDKENAQKLDPQQVRGEVAFENVTFAFRRPDGELDPPALKNITLKIKPGQRVGFLGATGAGKSALVNLIPRFYDVNEGRITIDGVDVRDLEQENLRQVVGIALQEAVLFQGDLRFNLKFANPDVDDEVMEAGARAADAYGFATNLPEKWDAPVSRRGYNFSGGQRQRLSMARALTAQPRILILDDSTSALDVATESRVQGNIPDYTHGATTIYVAQRISAVIDLDQIYLLQNGEIVDTGTHEELLRRSHIYQEIYESQLGAGVTAGAEVEK
jgi:ATP-binding cassette subfamily B protein